MVRSLFWKEWHEQRWKLGFGSIILMSFAAISLRARLMPDEDVVVTVVAIAGLLLPVLVSMGLVAPERADGSLRSLRALPAVGNDGGSDQIPTAAVVYSSVYENRSCTRVAAGGVGRVRAGSAESGVPGHV